MMGRFVHIFDLTRVGSGPSRGMFIGGFGMAAGMSTADRISDHQLIDDQKLLELAAEPERPLFPWLHENTSLAPLILLLAALAPAFAVQTHRFNANDALWSEKALECASAENFGQFVDPASRDTDVAFRWQPPLVTWLTAALQSVVGPEILSSLYFIPVLSAAGLILWCVVFARAWGGNRAGLATGLLVACHPQLLQVAPRAAPWVAGLGLGMLSLWGFIEHWNKSPKAFSWRLLVSGIAGGLCLLAGGPLALGLMIVTGLYISWWAVGRSFATTSWTVRGVLWGRRKIIQCWVIVAGLVALVAGWWLAIMMQRYGSPFATAWLTWSEGPAQSDLPDFAASLSHRLTVLAAPLYLGLTTLGVVRVLSDNKHRTDDADWRHRRLLLLWAAAALVIWIACGTLLFQSEDGAWAWRAFLVLPLLMLAAVGLVDIADRRLSFQASFGVLAATIIWSVLSGHWGTSDAAVDELSLSLLWRFLTTILIAALGWFLIHWSQSSRSRQSLVLTLLIAVVLSIHSIAGVRGVASQTTANAVGPELHEVRESLRSVGRARRVSLVALDSTSPPATASQIAATSASPAAVPPLLRWLVKSHFPRARVAIAQSWEQAIASASVASIQKSSQKSSPGSDDKSAPPEHLIIVWGSRSHLNVPPVSGLVQRHGPVLGIADIDLAMFVVPGSG